jgi:hypothetical protein
MNNWDMGIFKNFRLTERAKLQFRAEMFNAWNHTNFNSVDLSVGSGGLGQVTSARIPRIMQFALKLIF